MPRPPLNSISASTGVLLAGVDHVAAPSRVASSSRAGLTSTTAVVAPVRCTAASRALSPTPPAPKTASVCAGLGAQDVEHRLRAGLHAAGERAEQLERRVARRP